MSSLGELQAQRAAEFQKSTSNGAKMYQRFYKEAEKSANAARKSGNHVGAAVSFARYVLCQAKVHFIVLNVNNAESSGLL
jgi:hypothetical protein